MKCFCLKGRNRSVNVGYNYPIVVNCNFGVNNHTQLTSELNKVDRIFSNSETEPDLAMDLSLLNNNYPIAEYIQEKYGTPVGIVPVYGLRDSFDSQELLDCIEGNAAKGIAFMTMHFSADMDLYEKAIATRKIPVTSRGGKIVYRNAIKHKKSINILRENIDAIAELAIQYGFAISLGTTFRPAGICDACDGVHIEETNRQIKIAKYLTDKGCKVLLENVGHIGLDKLGSHCCHLLEADVPIMPLGPTVLDSCIGNDHISAAIGASFMGYFNALHIINAISPAEHLKSSITYEDAKEGIMAAKIAAQSINCIRIKEYMNKENDVYLCRSRQKDCLAGNELCTRCADKCPLK